jgi:hypothetical protein
MASTLNGTTITPTETKTETSEDKWAKRFTCEQATDLLFYCYKILNFYQAFRGLSIMFQPSTLGFLQYIKTITNSEKLFRQTQVDKRRITFTQWCELFMLILLDDIQNLQRYPSMVIPGLTFEYTKIDFKGTKHCNIYTSLQNVHHNTIGVIITGEWFSKTYGQCHKNLLQYKLRTSYQNHPFFEKFQELMLLPRFQNKA